MQEIADDVFVAEGTDVNWILVRDGRDLTLIDAGWYADLAAVEGSIRAVGCRPEDVRAVLLTHAHIDHVGGASRLHERYGLPVYASPTEAAHARREFLEQATPADLIKRSWRPRVLGWSLRVLRAGGLRPIVVPDALPFPEVDAPPFPGASGPLDLPGHPVPIASPGHTSGHSAYLLPRVGVLASGDALVTGHPTLPVVGPQLLPDPFTHCQADAVAALEILGAVAADVLVPGHGRPWWGSIREAAASAAERAAAG